MARRLGNFLSSGGIPETDQTKIGRGDGFAVRRESERTNSLSIFLKGVEVFPRSGIPGRAGRTGNHHAAVGREGDRVGDVRSRQLGLQSEELLTRGRIPQGDAPVRKTGG